MLEYERGNTETLERLLAELYFLLSHLRLHVCVLLLCTSHLLSKPAFQTTPATMSTRGRSTSPHPLHDADVDMDTSDDKSHAKVVIITNLTRSVVESHLQVIFGFYGEIAKIDLPIYAKCKFRVYLCLKDGGLERTH